MSPVRNVPHCGYSLKSKSPKSVTVQNAFLLLIDEKIEPDFVSYLRSLSFPCILVQCFCFWFRKQYEGKMKSLIYRISVQLHLCSRLVSQYEFFFSFSMCMNVPKQSFFYLSSHIFCIPVTLLCRVYSGFLVIELTGISPLKKEDSQLITFQFCVLVTLFHFFAFGIIGF